MVACAIGIHSSLEFAIWVRRAIAKFHYNGQSGTRHRLNADPSTSAIAKNVKSTARSIITRELERERSREGRCCGERRRIGTPCGGGARATSSEKKEKAATGQQYAFPPYVAVSSGFARSAPSSLLIEEYDLGAGTWQLTLPGGKVTDPTPDGVRRQAEIELRGEIGYRTGKLEKLLDFYSYPGYISHKVHLFVAQELEWEVETSIARSADAVWME